MIIRSSSNLSTSYLVLYEVLEIKDEILSVVVVGAGVAGLSTAWLINQAAHKMGRSIELKILEAGPRHGGATRTDNIEGYLCEWGPNGFLDNEPATLNLVKSLGMEAELIRASEASSRRFIYHTGKMRPVPMTPPAFLRSNIVPFSAKLRMAMEIAIPARKDGVDETVKSFGERRLGKVFAKYLLDPMVSGIFAGNTAELSLKAIFPKMVEMERDYGGLFRALIAKHKEARKKGGKTGGPAGPGATLHTFRQGMGQLTDELARQLQSSIQTDTEVIGLEKINGRFLVRSIDKTFLADVVVLAVPSYTASEIITKMAPEVAKALSGISYAPVDVVCYGYSDNQLTNPLNGFGVLIPRCESLRSLGTLWSDQIFPGQAPTGRRLLRTIIGGAHDPGIVNVTEGDLHKIAQKDHLTVMGVSGEPIFKKLYRHSRGIAQYNVGHLERVSNADKLEQELPGLFFTGAAYRGVSVNGTAKDAYRVAELALKFR